MKYEDLPDDIKADIPNMLEDITAGKRSIQDVAQEIKTRLDG